MTADSLKITEIFFSIQGESNTCGIPTVFIRLTGCPLRCVYCDTAYAFSGGSQMSLVDILQRVRTYATKYVTVTGGEPLAQQACLPLLVLLADAGYQVSLETSGALAIAGVDSRVVKVMDLKTPSSGEASKNNYQNIALMRCQDQIKFVIGDDGDYQWAKSTVQKYGLTDKCWVLFGAVAGAMQPQDLAQKILDDGLEVKMQIQLHKYLWGDVAGR